MGAARPKLLVWRARQHRTPAGADRAKTEPTAWSLVAAFRILGLLGGASALIGTFVFAPKEQRLPSVRLACPMHPQITATATADCPLCGMALIPIGDLDPAQGLEPATDQISAARRRLVAQEVQAPAWTADNGDILALIYKEDAAAMGPDERGAFVVDRAPRANASVVRRATEAPSEWDASTSLLRFRVEAHTAAPPRGSVGRLVLAPKPHEVLMVPVAAVLQDREGSYVLGALADGPGFARQRVTIGKVTGGFAVVLTGLNDEQRIVARDAFFRDAERRLRGL